MPPLRNILAGDSLLDLAWYAFGEQPEQRWFLQPDVRDFFHGSLRLFSDDLVCVYQRSESYVESVWAYSEIQHQGVASAELRNPDWISGYNQVRSLYLVGCGRFLTPTVSSGLQCELSRYRDGLAYHSADGRIAAVRSCERTPVSNKESIYIRKDVIPGARLCEPQPTACQPNPPSFRFRLRCATARRVGVAASR